MQENYFVLGGVSVFEAQVHFITSELDKLAQSINPSDPDSVEFHASEIFSRRTSPWKKMSRGEAQGVIKSVLRVMADSYDSAKAFACALHKPSFSASDPVELAFEDLTSRFDRYLNKLREDGDRQRGMMLLDQSSYETSLQKLAKDFRQLGTRWGGVHNLADVPMFVSSSASRIIQLADHVAYATFRRYQAHDLQYFEIIANKFHAVDNVIHGLSHKQNVDRNCMCPACLTRRMSSS